MACSSCPPSVLPLRAPHSDSRTVIRAMVQNTTVRSCRWRCVQHSGVGVPGVEANRDRFAFTYVPRTSVSDTCFVRYNAVWPYSLRTWRQSCYVAWSIQAQTVLAARLNLRAGDDRVGGATQVVIHIDHNVDDLLLTLRPSAELLHVGVVWHP